MMNVNKWHFILSALVLCSDPGEARHQTLSCPKSLLHPNNDHIDCSDENLTRVPHNPVLTAVALDLSYNKLIVVRNKELLNTGYVNIEELFMYNNNINRLEDEAFRDLTKLTSVSMQHNRLTVINKDILKNNLNLQILVLSFNPLTLPSSDTVSLINSTSLTHLYLSNCNLTRVTRGLFTETPNLTMLDVSYNKLTTFNWVPFKHLHQVQRLFLEHNQIRNVECDHEMLFSLTELYISAPESQSSYVGRCFTFSSPGANVYLNGNPLERDCCSILTIFGLNKGSTSSISVICTYEDAELEREVDLKKCFVSYMQDFYNRTVDQVGTREQEQEVHLCNGGNVVLEETERLKLVENEELSVENQLLEKRERKATLVTRIPEKQMELCNREKLALDESKSIMEKERRMFAEHKCASDQLKEYVNIPWLMFGIGAFVVVMGVTICVWILKGRRSPAYSYQNVPFHELLESLTHIDQAVITNRNEKLPKLPWSTTERPRDLVDLREVLQYCTAKRPTDPRDLPQQPHSASIQDNFYERPRSVLEQGPGDTQDVESHIYEQVLE